MSNTHPTRRGRTITVGCLLLALCATLACTPDSVDSGSEAGRVAVLAPALAEMLHALELDDQVVAIGAYGPWPAGWEELPQVGSFDRPSLERLREFEVTDVVTTQTAVAAGPLEQIERLGIRVIAAPTDTYEGTLASLLALGREFDRQELAGSLVESIRAEISEVESRAEDLPPRSVVVIVGRDPLYVAGPESHLDTLVRVSGGTNIFSDLDHSYAQVSMEALLERAPDVILDCSTEPGEESLSGVASERWASWDVLPAVQNDRVYQISPSRLSIPGVRLGEMARFVQSRLYPELQTEAP